MEANVGPIDQDVLKRLAAKYIWWKTPDEAARQPARVVAQVMELGDYDDAQLLAVRLGDDYMRETLAHAEAGWFTERSWTYWHYRLGLSRLGQVPEMPRRHIA
jgi:hypothetical protein